MTAAQQAQLDLEHLRHQSLIIIGAFKFLCFQKIMIGFNPTPPSVAPFRNAYRVNRFFQLENVDTSLIDPTYNGVLKPEHSKNIAEVEFFEPKSPKSGGGKKQPQPQPQKASSTLEEVVLAVTYMKEIGLPNARITVDIDGITLTDEPISVSDDGENLNIGFMILSTRLNKKPLFLEKIIFRF